MEALSSRSVSLFMRCPIKKAESKDSLIPPDFSSSKLKGRTSLNTPCTSSYPRWAPARTSLRAPTSLISEVPLPTNRGPIELPTPMIDSSGSAKKIISGGSTRTNHGPPLAFTPLSWLGKSVCPDRHGGKKGSKLTGFQNGVENLESLLRIERLGLGGARADLRLRIQNDVETDGFRTSDSSSTAAESRTDFIERHRLDGGRGSRKRVFVGLIAGLILRVAIGGRTRSEFNRASIFLEERAHPNGMQKNTALRSSRGSIVCQSKRAKSSSSWPPSSTKSPSSPPSITPVSALRQLLLRRPDRLPVIPPPRD
ncbi:hydroxysteroid dehydrogenase 1 [Striga asiatica]|uniref:Hydroxysteroid dehydrogenase 1 n=1 Tax=Striga asiatica TaxID=4170 RepID=A0A5A7R5H1_STRAF|nr:hydroxysteroid dehydrogenase 1 [Striga asiatica]